MIIQQSLLYNFFNNLVTYYSALLCACIQVASTSRLQQNQWITITVGDKDSTLLADLYGNLSPPR